MYWSCHLFVPYVLRMFVSLYAYYYVVLHVCMCVCVCLCFVAAFSHVLVLPRAVNEALVFVRRGSKCLC